MSGTPLGSPAYHGGQNQTPEGSFAYGGPGFGTPAEGGFQPNLWARPPDYDPQRVSDWARTHAEHFPQSPSFPGGRSIDYDWTADIERAKWLQGLTDYHAHGKAGKGQRKQLEKDIRMLNWLNKMFYDEGVSLQGYWGEAIRPQYEGILPDEPFSIRHWFHPRGYEYRGQTVP